MEIFGNIFGNKKLETIDPDFGKIERFSKKGNKICWKINKRYLGYDIEILIAGNKNGISNNQKLILLNAINNEPTIKSESEAALREQYENAKIKFESIENQFDLKRINVTDEGLELSFQQKEEPCYFFNIHFENNKQIGVSIDS